MNFFSKKDLDKAKEPPKICPTFKHLQTSDESYGAYLEYKGLKVIVDAYNNGEIVLLTELNGEMVADTLVNPAMSRIKMLEDDLRWWQNRQEESDYKAAKEIITKAAKHIQEQERSSSE